MFGVVSLLLLVRLLAVGAPFLQAVPMDQLEGVIARYTNTVADTEGLMVRYPYNVALHDLYYFWAAPTLTYQINFPRSPNRRLWMMGSLLLRMALVVSLMVFFAQQQVRAEEKNATTIDGCCGGYSGGGDGGGGGVIKPRPWRPNMCACGCPPPHTAHRRCLGLVAVRRLCRASARPPRPSTGSSSGTSSSGSSTSPSP